MQQNNCFRLCRDLSFSKLAEQDNLDNPWDNLTKPQAQGMALAGCASVSLLRSCNRPWTFAAAPRTPCRGLRDLQQPWYSFPAPEARLSHVNVGNAARGMAWHGSVHVHEHA